MVEFVKLDDKKDHDVKSAFATLSRDESHKKSQVQTTGSTFGARTNDWNNNKNNGHTSQNRRFVRNSNLICKHCHMTGHTIYICFEFVGNPSGFKKRSVNGQSTGGNAANNVVPARTGP
ncbi:hypothetical protein Tco_0603709, partial [Tanacetum coccineum]